MFFSCNDNNYLYSLAPTCFRVLVYVYFAVKTGKTQDMISIKNADVRLEKVA
jgi:hypothetical protein